MNDIIAWVMANMTGILAAIAAVHVAAVAIANLTPTPKDNELIAKAYRIVEVLAGIITPKAKQ